MKIYQILQLATETLSKYNILEPELDAKVLLADTLNCNLLQLYLKYFSDLETTHEQDFLNKINLRAKHIPLNYLTSKKEFMGLEFKITPFVFIPRQETEILVEETIELIIEKFHTHDCINILDFGTGIGNISISIAKFLPEHYNLKIFAVDISNKVIEIARKNAKIHKVEEKINFLICPAYKCKERLDLIDFYRRLSSSHSFDIIVSNPPYISAKEFKKLQKEILFEPLEAINGGPDGLKFYRLISKISNVILKKGGYVILEIGYAQLEEVKRIFHNCGFKLEKVVKDYSGYDRVVNFFKGLRPTHVDTCSSRLQP